MIYFCAVVHALIELNIYAVVQVIMISAPTLRIKNAFHRFPNAELAYKIMVIIRWRQACDLRFDRFGALSNHGEILIDW
jgi:hypothetical protein